jgi:APA family basic amino acid/polyamine antiporter
MQEQPARGSLPGAGRLGVLDASLIVVGSIVGAGIFLVSHAVAREVSSPAAFLGVWLLGGCIALAGALSNGELGGLYPRSGGEYVYLREAYGPPLGFLSGWTSFWVAFPGSIAALAAGFGATMASMLGVSGRVAEVAIGAAAIVALTAVNVAGLRPGKWAQNVLSGAKLLAFAGLLALGALVGHRGSGGLTPFFGQGDSARGVASALIPVFFAYSGWNAATYVTGEMRDPTRSLGRALALGTGLCVALYVAVNAVYLRGLSIADLAATEEPARAAAMALGGNTATAMLMPLVALCVLSSMQASVLVGPRIYRAMAVDGVFFAPLGKAHGSEQVPAIALVAQAVIALVELLSGRFEDLLSFATSAMLAFSTLTVAAVLVLRVRRPEAARPFRVPGYPVIPLAFIAANGWVLCNVLASGARPVLGAVAVVATGIPAYVAFTMWERRKEKAR